MLWEARDPEAVLRERFGFEDGPAAARWISDRLSQWGIRARSCRRIVMSSHNALAWVDSSYGRVVVKWSIAPALFPRLRETARMTQWLGDRGLPVSAPLRALDGSVQIDDEHVSMAVQREIDSPLLDVADPAQVGAAGVTLARLQDALRDYPGADAFSEFAAVPTGLAERVTRWLGSDAAHAPAAACDVLRDLVKQAPSDNLPMQLGHNDFRAANVLWSGSDVAAVLDFEEARIDHRIVELARANVLLGTLFHDWAPLPVPARADFLAAYRSVCRLSDAEVAWCEIATLWTALAMVPAGADPTGWGRAATAYAEELATR